MRQPDTNENVEEGTVTHENVVEAAENEEVEERHENPENPISGQNEVGTVGLVGAEDATGETDASEQPRMKRRVKVSYDVRELVRSMADRMMNEGVLTRHSRSGT